MKFLALFLALVPSASFAGSIPRVQAENWQGYALQPCLIWYTNGACGRYFSNADLADRRQVNRTNAFLEWRIEQREARLAK